MVKLSTVLIVIFVLTWTGIFCAGGSAQKADHKASPRKGPSVKSSEMLPIFVTTCKIKKGTKISKKMVVEKLVSTKSDGMQNLENSAIGLAKFVIGRRPGHDLVKGQIILADDIWPYPEGIIERVIFTTKEIPAGAAIQKGDVDVIRFVFYRPVEFDKHRPTDCSTVIGKKARIKLSKSHRLVDGDVIP